MLFDKFDRVVCVNLPQRQDRWEVFKAGIPADWDLGEIERYEAIAGKLCKRPEWWTAGGGAWGCYRSHLRILEECLNRGQNSCLFLEDDARFGSTFVQDARDFINRLPEDWGMIYLGGQHLHAQRHPPARLKEGVCIPYNVNRTHAFAIRGRGPMLTVYKHLNDTKGWRTGQHIDHHLGRLHQRRNMPIYCPDEWLVSQAAGYSNISGKTNPEKVWNHAADIIQLPDKLTLVLGPHRCGSSCVAMMLHKLGVHMGNRFVGAEMHRGGSGEAHELSQIMENAMPFPATGLMMNENRLRARLQKLVLRMTREADERGTVAGLKYPQLAMFAPVVEELCGGEIRIVDVRRPLEESIESMARRCPKVERRDVEAHQTLLYDLRDQYVEKFNGPTIRVDFSAVIEDPAGTVESLKTFLGLASTSEQIAAAVDHPKKEHRHIG